MGATGHDDSPDPALVLALFRRVAGGDRTAEQVFIALLFEPLRRRLQRRWPRVDAALIDDSAEDALLMVCRRPSVYKETQLPVWNFLDLVATRDLLDGLRRQARRQRRELPMAGVPESAIAVRVEQVEPARSGVPRGLFVGWTRQEVSFLKARLLGEHDSHALAVLIGVESPDPHQERRSVKRMADRLGARLRRKGKFLVESRFRSTGSNVLSAE